MSQTSVTSYFNTRKRRPSEELRNKSKVLILHDNDKTETLGIFPEEKSAKEVDKVSIASQIKKDLVARNLQFDLISKQSKPKARVPRSKKVSHQIDESQPTIQASLQKAREKEDKVVVFEKLGTLSPKKTHQKRITRQDKEKEKKLEAIEEVTKEPAYMKTPTKSSPIKDMTLDEIKTKVTTSSRIAELRARIDNFKKGEDKLQKLEQLHKQKLQETKKNKEQIKIREFDRIQVEIPVSPKKSPAKFLSPIKFVSPTKTLVLSPHASPARRALFEPKEPAVIPVTASPTKTPAYQRYQSLVETDAKALPLPYHYRFLAETFNSIDTIVAMIHNRKEVVTFSKLKPSVQKLTRKNFTLDILAQIMTIFPDAFTLKQQKMRSYCGYEGEKYELVITPLIEIDTNKSGRNTPDEDNIIKSAQQTWMSPNILVDRKKIFYAKLLDIVRDEHEKFLLSLEPPMRIPKEKITRWHPEFDVELCRDIEKAVLPQPPVAEKALPAKELLEKFHLSTSSSRMKKAIEKLADMNTNVPTTPSSTHTPNITDLQKTPEAARNINSSIVDTPPATPKTHNTDNRKSVLKGIPQALLEKIRAKEAAKALDMMTRSEDEDKNAIKYARLPEMAKILRNIFVSEKKNVLLLEIVVKKLDDSYRLKLPLSELEEHIRLICKLEKSWATIEMKRNMYYMKLAKDYDMAKVISRLEKLADEKV